jgi:G3E family GTPase
VLTSHACCVFINAQALVHDREYAQSLEDIFNQVVAIASMVQQHQLNYAFAIVLTKCDLLESGSITQLQIEQNLQPLLIRLDAIKANYRRFYSAIPIVSISGMSTLNARGSADPLLWLLSELNQHYHFQSQQNLATNLSQNSFTRQIFPTHLRRSVMLLMIASLSILGIAIAILVSSGLFTPTQLPAKEQSSNL